MYARGVSIAKHAVSPLTDIWGHMLVASHTVPRGSQEMRQGRAGQGRAGQGRGYLCDPCLLLYSPLSIYSMLMQHWQESSGSCYQLNGSTVSARCMLNSTSSSMQHLVAGVGCP